MTKHRTLFTFAAIFLLAACESRSLPSPVVGSIPPPPIAPTVVKAPRQVVSCTPEGHGCSDDSECCGGYCDSFTYAPVVCHAPLADGAQCYEDRHCASGACRNYVCGGSCNALAAACERDGDCCQGFCDNYTYAPWICTAPLQVGSSCYDDKHCQSGHCLDYVCAL